MTQNLSSEVVLRNTAEAVIAPLKDGISSLNRVYEALIKADVDPITGKCSNYDSIRQLIVQAHEHLQQSERVASSGLKSLDENLEKLTQEQGKLEREKSSTETLLQNLKTELASNEKLLRDSQGAMQQANDHLNSVKHTLDNQRGRKNHANTVRDVGAGLFAIPILGWIAGSAMLISGSVELEQAEHAVKVAEEEMKKSENEMRKFVQKASEYQSKISQSKNDISQKDDKLRQIREGIQKVKKQRESVADFQQKARSAVQLLGVLSGRASVAEHQTRRFILQEPVMKVMEDVMKATKEITGNELLNNKDVSKLIDQMKENNQRLAAICASESSAG